MLVGAVKFAKFTLEHTISLVLRPLNMPSQVIGEYVESLFQVKEVLYVKREELLTENSLIIHCQTISSLCFFHVGVELT